MEMECRQDAADLPIAEQKLCHGYGVLYNLARERKWVAKVGAASSLASKIC